MQQFAELGLPQPLLETLQKMNFETPTPIQAAAIPLALEGRDILGSAQTGTGKTGAFGIPLVAKLLNSSRGSALVLTPTRELAVQVMQTMQQLIGRNSPIKTALLIGGEAMPKQFQQLRARPRLIVGTPGRINDHLGRGTLALHDTSFLVLDETDRMLDLGFGVQLEAIAKYLPKQRQTLMFSATMPKNIMKLSEQYLTNPERIAVGGTSAPAENLKQEVVNVTEGEKYEELLKQLENREGSIIIFVKTKHGADKMAERLRRQDYAAEAIHGDLRQNRRDKVIAQFRSMKYNILVATDVAARGLDIPHIKHVINYDLPQCPEDYIHRIGRTARAGAEGEAICLITRDDARKWRAIQQLLKTGESDDDGAFEGYRSKKKRSHSDRSYRRDRDARPASGGFRPERNDRPAREERGNDWSVERPARADKPFRGDRDRNERPAFGNRDDRPARSDRPFRSDKPFRDRDDRPARNRDDRPARADKPFRGDRDRNERPAFGNRDDRPARSDRPFRSDKPFRDRDDRPARNRDERPFRSDKPFREDRPARSGDRPQRGDKPFRSDKPLSAPKPKRSFFNFGNKKNTEGASAPLAKGGKKFGFGKRKAN